MSEAGLLVHHIVFMSVRGTTCSTTMKSLIVRNMGFKSTTIKSAAIPSATIISTTAAHRAIQVLTTQRVGLSLTATTQRFLTTLSITLLAASIPEPELP